MPIKGITRVRCVKCYKDKKGRKNDKRTLFTCKACDVPLCFSLFTPYHVKNNVGIKFSKVRLG